MKTTITTKTETPNEDTGLTTVTIVSTEGDEATAVVTMHKQVIEELEEE